MVLNSSNLPLANTKHFLTVMGKTEILLHKIQKSIVTYNHQSTITTEHWIQRITLAAETNVTRAVAARRTHTQRDAEQHNTFSAR